jgi:hypothetical protein
LTDMSSEEYIRLSVCIEEWKWKRQSTCRSR